MKKSLIITGLLLPILSFATVTGIYDIWEPQSQNEPYLVLVGTGDVFEIKDTKKKELSELEYAKENKLLVDLDVIFKQNKKFPESKRKTIKSIKLLKTKYIDLYTRDDGDEPDLNAPTYTVNAMGMEEANTFFDSMRTNTREKSQCYNRAHVWTYELHKNHNIGTMKNWMFFTRKYINEYRYHWWFHVTPYTIVHGYGQVALDRKFTKSPTPIVPWKNIFMKNNADCPIISNYSSYRDNQYTNYCYWIQTNMYFWQPYQIEALERGAASRWGWKPNELSIAYRDAIY